MPDVLFEWSVTKRMMSYHLRRIDHHETTPQSSSLIWYVMYCAAIRSAFLRFYLRHWSVTNLYLCVKPRSHSTNGTEQNWGLCICCYFIFIQYGKLNMKSFFLCTIKRVFDVTNYNHQDLSFCRRFWMIFLLSLKNQK